MEARSREANDTVTQASGIARLYAHEADRRGCYDARELCEIAVERRAVVTFVGELSTPASIRLPDPLREAIRARALLERRSFSNTARVPPFVQRSRPKPRDPKAIC